MRLRAKVKNAALILLSYFWHSNQLCKLEKITLHPHFHRRISHVRTQRKQTHAACIPRCLFGLPTPYLLPFMGCMLSQT